MVFSNYLDKSQSNYTTKKIDIKNIQSITYKSPNRSIGKGMLTGALTGFLVGGLVGLVSGSSDSDGFIEPGGVALGLGLMAAIPGTLIGAIVGSAKIRIPIKGNQNRFKAKKSELMKLKAF